LRIADCGLAESGPAPSQSTESRAEGTPSSANPHSAIRNPQSSLLPWDAALERAAARPQTIALVGGPDTGKTTFALALGNRLAGEGARVALVDADVGQSSVGPPGTVGLALFHQPVAAASELRPAGLAFVGDVAPDTNLLAVALGTASLARRAAERGAQWVVVDTSGLVSGRLGERLKLAKLHALQPAVTLVFRRGGDLERLVTLLGDAGAGEVLSVIPAPGVRRKSPPYRRAQRERLWARAFHGAAAHEFSAAAVQVVNAWPFTGRELPAHYLRFASEALGTEVLHGEETGDGIWFCTVGRADRRGYALLQEQFRRRTILTAPETAFRDLLVGLVGQEGRLLGIGSLARIHFARGLLEVITPVAADDAVRQIWFGRVRVRPDGIELGRLRPGEM
jgi:polynucleotide 5'-hydroxyl-kinase GRC3/NOL9